MSSALSRTFFGEDIVLHHSPVPLALPTLAGVLDGSLGRTACSKGPLSTRATISGFPPFFFFSPLFFFFLFVLSLERKVEKGGHTFHRPYTLTVPCRWCAVVDVPPACTGSREMSAQITSHPYRVNQSFAPLTHPPNCDGPF